MPKRFTAVALLILWAGIARAQSGAPLQCDAAEIQVSQHGNGQAVREACLEAPSDPDLAALVDAMAAANPAREKLRARYTFHEIYQEDRLDAVGNRRPGSSQEYQIFAVNGRSIQRLVKRNGAALSAAEQKREDARVARDFEKFRADAPVTPQPSLPLAAIRSAIFSNVRHVPRAGRDTLVVDFAPGPQAGGKGLGEGMSGTVWIDEADREWVRFEGRNQQGSGAGPGLEGTSLVIEQTRMADGLWMPSWMEERFGDGKRLSRCISTTDSDFRKFEAPSALAPAAMRR